MFFFFFLSINRATVRFELISGYFLYPPSRIFFSRPSVLFFDAIARCRSGNSYLQSLNEIPTHRAVLQLRGGSLVGYIRAKHGEKRNKRIKPEKASFPAMFASSIVALRKLAVRGEQIKLLKIVSPICERSRYTQPAPTDVRRDSRTRKINHCSL